MKMFKRYFFCSFLVVILGTSCSSHKVVSIPVSYSSSSSPIPDSTSNLSGDGRLELKRYNAIAILCGKNKFDWKLSIEDAKEDIFLIYSEEVQINFSHENIEIRLTPKVIEQPEELKVSDHQWSFVLDGCEFWIDYEDWYDDNDFQIQGLVEWKEKKLARRIKRFSSLE